MFIYTHQMSVCVQGVAPGSTATVDILRALVTPGTALMEPTPMTLPQPPTDVQVGHVGVK